MKQLRVYLDTSVISFLEADDAPEKQQATIEFFEVYVKLGLYDVYFSDVVLTELDATPDVNKRQNLFDAMKRYPMSFVEIQDSEDIEFLAKMYIQKGIIPSKKEADALHVALSTVNEMDVLLS